MGKALVIKNVNFSANALDHVNLIDDVPCTGISLNQSEVSVTNLDSFTITAAVTPSTTTDAVLWSSSDDTVASVINGVVTPHKAGSAVITASCGSQTASCVVTIRVFLDVDFDLHYYFQKKTSAGGDTVELGGGLVTTTYGFSRVDADQTGNNRHAYKQTSSDYEGTAYPLKMLDGMTGLAFSVPNQDMKISPYWADSSSASSFGTWDILFVQSEDASPWGSAIPSGSRVVAVPDAGEDSFFISVFLSSSKGTLTQEMLDAITVEVLYDEIT